MARCYPQVIGSWPLSESKWFQGCNHGLNHASSQGDNRPWATCSLSQFSRKFLMESLQLSQWGKRWVVQLPQLALWDRVRGDAALFESLFPPFVKGGLRGQGVRLDCSNEHTRTHPSVVAKGLSASHPHQPLFPPLYDSHFPPQTHKWSMRFPTSRPARCSLPVARSQRTSPHRPAPSASKAGVSEALQPLRLHW
jgi:hypothetical protein